MKVPKPRKLKSGMYNIQLRLNGRSVSVTRETAQNCVKDALLIKAEHKAGVKEKARIGKNMTLGEAIDSYIASRSNVLSPSTIKGYNAIKRTRFKSVQGKPINNINWQMACNDETKLCSAKTLKNAYGFVKSVLKYHNMNVPNVTLPQVIEKDLAWIEPEYIHLFLSAVQGDICEYQILLGLHGLRCSEIMAKPIVKNGFIHIEGSVVYGDNGKLTYKQENKNKTSRREVPVMIPRLLEIQNHKDVYPNTVCRHVNMACGKIGIKPVGTHGLRRTFASLCYHLGLSELQTQKLGGWSEYSTVRKIYTKLSEKDKAIAENKLIDFYKNANRNANGNTNILQIQAV